MYPLPVIFIHDETGNPLVKVFQTLLSSEIHPLGFKGIGKTIRTGIAIGFEFLCANDDPTDHRVRTLQHSHRNHNVDTLL